MKNAYCIMVLILHYTILYLPFPIRFERTKTVQETMTRPQWDQSVYPRSHNIIMCQHPLNDREVYKCMSFVDSNLNDKIGNYWYVTKNSSKGRNSKDNRYMMPEWSFLTDSITQDVIWPFIKRIYSSTRDLKSSTRNLGIDLLPNITADSLYRK